MLRTLIFLLSALILGGLAQAADFNAVSAYPSPDVYNCNISLAPSMLGYDESALPQPVGPVRDDPGEDWIIYDSNQPSTLTPAANYWARVTFTPNADFTLWGASVMPLNSGPNPNAPCDVRVYRENQDSRNLTDLAWEGRFDQLRAWNRDDINANWHWIEIPEDDRPDFEGGESFSILYGPAPGGAYPGGQGSGWWVMWDGGTEVQRSYYAPGPPMEHANWAQLGGDLFIRANGEYTGDFIDLEVAGVYNAAELEDRHWIVLSETERTLYAVIVNRGAAVEEFFVNFHVLAPDGEEVFQREVAVEEIGEEETMEVECPDVWEIPEEVGLYEVWVDVEADGDANRDNNRSGMDQIVFDQELSRDQWIGYVDAALEGRTNYQQGNGWAVRFDHPGGALPLWITAFRASINAANIDPLFKIYVFDIGQELGAIDIDPVWEGTIRTAGGEWVEHQLDEDEYITIHEGQGFVVVYYFVDGGTFGHDQTPPLAGTNLLMPSVMLTSAGYGETFNLSVAGDYGIQVQLSGPDHGGVMFGNVSDLSDGSPVEDAVVTTSQGHQVTTDEEGNYFVDYGPRGAFTATAFKPGYNPCEIDDLELQEGDTLEVNFTLRHPEFTPSVRRIIAETGFEGAVESPFTVANTGNGPLTYTVERRLPVDFNIDPWTLRNSYHAAAPLEDNYLQGVVFIDDRFYVAGQNDRQPLIYVLDREGQPVDSFAQPGEDNRGMNDMTWDGSLIWGISGAAIYGFTSDGEESVSFAAPMALGKNIAWDAENGCLWVSGTTTEIFSLSPQGDRIGSIRAIYQGEQLRMYGLDCYPDDPTGHTLYIFCKERDTDRTLVLKADPANGEIVLVAYLDHEEGGSPMGVCITNQYDIYSWTLVAVCNNSPADGGDRIDVWQVDARRDWFQIAPEEGTLQAAEEQEFVVSFSAMNLVFATFEGELVFHHNAADGESIIPISFNVVEGPVWTSRTLHLVRGWNMVSVNLQPEPDDIVELTRPLTEDGNLLLMKDGEGHFYNPEWGFINMGPWRVFRGYMMRLDHAADLTLEGMSVMAGDAIDLRDGWQLIAYYPRESVDAIVAFSGIQNQLVLAKDIAGHFYNPEWEFSNMGNLAEGQGYLVKMDGEAELSYRLSMEEGRLARSEPAVGLPILLPLHACTGENMSLLVLNSLGLTGEIGIWAEGELIGSALLTTDMTGVALWGDDVTTDELDGAQPGDELVVMLADQDGQRPVDYTTFAGSNRWEADGFWAIELTGESAAPVEFGISSVYPNPFNAATRVSFSLRQTGAAQLSLFDTSGRLMWDSGWKNFPAGMNALSIDGSALPSGIYFLRLDSQGHSDCMKTVLMR